MEVSKVGLHVLLVFLPSHSIHSNRRRLLQVEEGFSQAVFADMVQQGGELERAVLAGSFAYAVQSAGLAFDPARCPAQGGLSGVPLG